MNENYGVVFAQHEVRRPREIAAMKRVSKSISMKIHTHLSLRLCVLALYSRHHLRTGNGINNVSHFRQLRCGQR